MFFLFKYEPIEKQKRLILYERFRDVTVIIASAYRCRLDYCEHKISVILTVLNDLSFSNINKSKKQYCKKKFSGI